ncbi:acyltransferase [Aureibaculum conchae]|uniref:acyltransferase n=1 Tax=Aureibaculum sp. 2308TA14-22 TaxID=3108392 RepID=UPI0033935717
MKKKSFFSKILWIIYNQFKYGYGEKFRVYLKIFFWKRFLKNVGANLFIHPSVLIRRAEGISIGDNVNINHGSELYGGGGLTIGNGSMIAYNVMVFTDSRQFKSNQNLKSLKGRVAKPVIIGSDVWIGAGSIIVPGVVISDHAIVAAGSVVTKNVNEWDIVAGNPAIKVGSRIENKID